MQCHFNCVRFLLGDHWFYTTNHWHPPICELKLWWQKHSVHKMYSTCHHWCIMNPPCLLLMQIFEIIFGKTCFIWCGFRASSAGRSRRTCITNVNGMAIVWLTRRHETSVKNAAFKNVYKLAWQQTVSSTLYVIMIFITLNHLQTDSFLNLIVYTETGIMFTMVTSFALWAHQFSKCVGLLDMWGKLYNANISFYTPDLP